MKSTFNMTAHEAEDELKRREIPLFQPLAEPTIFRFDGEQFNLLVDGKPVTVSGEIIS